MLETVNVVKRRKGSKGKSEEETSSEEFDEVKAELEKEDRGRPTPGVCG